MQDLVHSTGVAAGPYPLAEWKQKMSAVMATDWGLLGFFFHSKEAFIKLQTDDMKSDERSLQIKEQEERVENDLLQGPL